VNGGGRVPDMVRRLSDRAGQLNLGRRVGRDLRPPLPSKFAAFGDGAVVVPPARVNGAEHIEIGDGVVILEYAWLAVFPQPGLPAPRLRIGRGTHIGRSCHIACVGEVTIGEEVLTADQIFIADTYHAFENPQLPISQQGVADPKPVVIGPGAFLGIRSAVLRGVTIGENAYVAAGAVVVDDVPPRTVVAGNPARPVRAYDDAAKAWKDVSR